MKKAIIITTFLSLVSVWADDVTLGDLSARIDSLEKQGGGQSASGDDLPTHEDIEAIKKNLKALTGRFEELEHRVNQKLGTTSLAETTVIAVGPNVPPPIGSSLTPDDDDDDSPDMEGLSDEEAVLKLMEKTATPKKEAVEKVRDKRTKEAEKNPPLLESGNPLAQYNEAKALYDKKEYDKAERAFTDFIKTNPTDKLLHQAYYWQGDCQLKIGKCTKAKTSFVQCYQKNKTGPKTAESLFGLGQALLKDNKKQQACTAWKKLQTDFPKMSDELKKKLQDAKTQNKC